MKAPKKQLTQFTIKNVFFAFLFSIACLFSTAQENKNSLTLGAGVSFPDIKESGSNTLTGGSGSNFSINYSRQIIKANKGYYTLEGKFQSIKNSYLTDETTRYFNSNSQLTSVTGAFVGSSNKYEFSSYLIGVGFNRFLTKNEKLIGYTKIFIGSATLTNPSQSYSSKNLYTLKTTEDKVNSFNYSTEAGLSYDIFKNVSIGMGLGYTKSSFKIDNQKLILYFSGQSQEVDKDSYTLDYANFNLNAEVIFKF